MIWVIGGTSDATHIVNRLLVNGFENVLVSTTTSYGSDLAKANNVKVIQQLLNQADMLNLMAEYKIDLVIDASHPFAQEVSKNAILVCEKLRCMYLRFERETPHFDGASYYPSYDQMLVKLRETSGNILLTIGSKNIYLFMEFMAERVIARVLPMVQSIQQCDESGLKAHQIIAMNGRVSQQTNIALMKEYNIKHLVTKDSGEAGGLVEKISAATELGISVHILKRPKISYPNVVNNYDELVSMINSLSKN